MQFEAAVKQDIPDANFSGLAIIDFELWRPLFAWNWDALKCYQVKKLRLADMFVDDSNERGGGGATFLKSVGLEHTRLKATTHFDLNEKFTASYFCLLAPLAHSHLIRRRAST